MAIGDLILATKYNSIRAKVAAILGTGSGDKGYGQNLSASTDVKGVSAGTSPASVITELQWDNLRADITKAYTHQNNTAPTITNVTQSTTVQWAHAVQYDLLADGITTNKDTVAAGQYSTLASATKTWGSGWGGTNTGAGSEDVYQTITVSWPSADAARYFFNSGGYLLPTIDCSANPNTNTKTTDWFRLVKGLAGNNFNSAYYTPALYRLNANLPAGATVDTSYSVSPYTNDYITSKWTWIDTKSVKWDLRLHTQDAGAVAYNTSIDVNISTNIAYRQSIDQVTVTGPTFAFTGWNYYINGTLQAGSPFNT